MPKYLIALSIFISILIPLPILASTVIVPSHVLQEEVGLISLNCSNTNSCSSVDYKVVSDNNGNLFGYGWSDSDGWINFNPKYGGVLINSSGELSGWAWSENRGWLLFDSVENITARLWFRFRGAGDGESLNDFMFWLEKTCGIDFNNRRISNVSNFLSCLSK